LENLVKRSSDVVLSLVLLVLLSPLLLLCVAAVWLADGPPVLFRHKRVGRYGRPFYVLKFRTMRPEPGGEVTIAHDPRVTYVGGLLRRYKLDELPQLWNVLVGEMSIVGPRPEVPAYVARHERAYRAVWDLRPGITDWASILFRDEEHLLHAHRADGGFYERVLLPRKLALARLYRRRRSWGLDARLIVATPCAAAGLDVLVRALVGRSFAKRARAGFD
jgi:lipopolysaccharide/colanic/teichoic acid biosynthesis glycosyltransferase